MTMPRIYGQWVSMQRQPNIILTPAQPWNVGEDHPSIPCVPVVMHYLLFYISQVEGISSLVLTSGRDLLLPLGSGLATSAGVGRVRCPALGWVVGTFGQRHPALPSLHRSASAPAAAPIAPGVTAVTKRVQPSRGAGLQVAISLLRGLRKNEHGNTHTGKLTVKHRAGRLLCQIFKASWRKMVLKDYCGTVSWRILYSMALYHSVKRNNWNQPFQNLTAEFLFLKYLRNLLEALSPSLAS